MSHLLRSGMPPVAPAEQRSMRWDDFRRSDNIEDRRGLGGGAVGGLGVGTVLVLGLVGWALGIDPRLLINGAETISNTRTETQSTRPGRTGAPQDATGQFLAAVLGDTEDRWKELFQQAGRTYTGTQADSVFRRDRLRLRTGAVCNGTAQAEALRLSAGS